MFEWFTNLLSWAQSLWTDLSDDDKQKIVAMIVRAFAGVFQAWYNAPKTSSAEASA